MLIMLPPSEKKQTPPPGRPLDLSGISFADELTEIRAGLLAEHPEVLLDRAAPAHEIYSGFLYQALGYSTLTSAAKARAHKQILIFSALYGVVRIDEVISAYKFKIQPSLWRETLGEALRVFADELILDCRSATYAAPWVPAPERTVNIKVLTNSSGEVKVVTHMAKVTRGQVTRFLLEKKVQPKTPGELFKLLRGDFECELQEGDHKSPWAINIFANY